jgi:hypothetical protein
MSLLGDRHCFVELNRPVVSKNDGPICVVEVTR